MNKRLVAIGNRSGITIAVRYLVEANEMKAAEAAAERLAVAVRASFIAGEIQPANKARLTAPISIRIGCPLKKLSTIAR